MKKICILILALLLLTVSVSAEGYLVHDDAGLLSDHDARMLEERYSQYPDAYGFTPVLVTANSFGGMDAGTFAGKFYDGQGYPDDGILLLVSLQEGQWYILTNGACHDRISDRDAEWIGQELVGMLREGEYNAAFQKFPELAASYFEGDSVADDNVQMDDGPVPVISERSYGKTIAISMGAGLLIGLVVVCIMAYRMKTVRMQCAASDYIRPGSMRVTRSRDIFLYSHVHRTPRPKNNSSGGSRGGGSRGGAGGRI